MWYAEAEYSDGTYISKLFPYRENDNYYLECERQHDLEAWLIEEHDGCTYYSVSYVDEEEATWYIWKGYATLCDKEN